MGCSESLDIEEIKFICRQIMAGRTDTQIKSALEEDWGKRDIRTIRLIMTSDVNSGHQTFHAASNPA